ncbi:MAG: TrkA family potassium uptake protein [Candidatus Sericytochromatia bacterium]|uniref:TrkA family potassium uptake protein n=1 Tax=Candidatus Tanganyikabacteria bacterium TaxID=2961651 RepID=A0A937X506_9BACT|nr:TrkA family potassium uptake protein [Candidatus Tanganyikabacteria bacterium]
MAKQFAVVGLGRFGCSVCRTLHAAGHEVLAIDESEDLVRRALADQIATHAVQADATDKSALLELEIGQFDTVVIGIGTDLEAAVLTLLNLLECGVKTIVAKAIYERHAEVLRRIGGPAILVVEPERQMGEQVARTILEKSPAA